MVLVGIDIGGTKISACLGNEKGEILISKRISTPSLGGWEKGLAATIDLIHELLREKNSKPSQIEGIGIASPGPVSVKKGIMLNPPNLPSWEHAELVRVIKDAFHKPVVMNHDAKAAVLAEYQFGSAKGVQNLVYLTCSTGMGGGAIVEGKLVQGVSDTAAEIGHFVLERNGPQCPCGLKGCWEMFVGGRALAKKMKKEIEEGQIDTQVLREAEGKLDKINAECLVAAVKKKDPYALRVWDEYILRLAQGIGVILMNFNPEVIILGTIAIHSGPLLLEPLKKQLPQFAWKENIAACRIEASSLGNTISELSALALAMQATKKIVI